MVRLKAIVQGHVQGVYFRANTQHEAERLGLKGYVLNRPEGSVEVVAEGERAQLETLLAWLRHGPPRARVDQVSVLWGEASLEFTRFEVRG